MLEVKELVKSYGTGKNQHQVLRGVNFTIHKGEFAAIMGPSGSGKTTLLDCISRYKPFDSGEVLLNGKDLGKLNEKEMAKVRNEKIGFVFQDFMLLDGLTVFDNVCVPQVIKAENYKAMEKRASKLLKMLENEKIKIINFYEVLEFNYNITEILDEHDKILNTSGEKEIYEVFEGYERGKSNIAK